MKVIIFAYAKENHTAPVKWALEQAGYEVACWGGLSWTEQQQASLLLDAQTKMTLGPFTVEPGDAIWIRRPDVPDAQSQRVRGRQEICRTGISRFLPLHCIHAGNHACLVHQ